MRIRRSKRTWYLLLGVFVTVFTFTFLAQQYKMNEGVDAASLSGFDPGYIISDYQMSNYNSMSEADIQRFLTSKNPCSNSDYNYYLALSANRNYTWHWANGHFVCLSEERFGDGEVIGSGQTAAHIIWQAAQDYRINPQVLLVLLQKETSLITDPIPNNSDYRKATGYGCPDTAPCSSEYYGFKNQIRKAASLFRTVLDGGWTNYPLGNNYIQYNPNSGCGGSVVNIRSLATSALYRYTPYQPNAATLEAGYGTAYCGAYGNRNFYLFFEDWFGGITYGRSLLEAEKKIEEAISGGIDAGGRVGVNYINGTQNVYALYEKGVFYVKDNGSPIFIKSGSIRDLYRQYNLESGIMGYPISNEIGGLKDGATYQLFEKAVVYQHPTLGTHVVFSGPIRDLYRQYRLESGAIGYPISNEIGGLKDGATYQLFEKAVVYRHPTLGTHMVFSNSIRDLYRQYSLESGIMGYPISNEIGGLKDGATYQLFEKAVVYRHPTLGTHMVFSNSIRDLYRQYSLESGIMGYPISNEIGGLKDGATYQLFEKAVVYRHPTLGTHAVVDGDVREMYRLSGLENGEFGFPISEENNSKQLFQNRVVDGGYIFTKKIYNKYQTSANTFGVPLSNVICGLKDGGCYQIFSSGVVYSSSKGAFLVPEGAILNQFRLEGREQGIGYPVSSAEDGGQQFEHGVIKD